MQLVRRIFSFLVVLAVPVVLVMGAIRLMLNPWYPEFEYRTPGFPADPFGFTFEERLKYSKIAIQYLVIDADISYLGNQRFPDGETAPAFSCQFMQDCNLMYNERELGHMLDVKLVVQAALKVWAVALGIVLLGGVWAWLGKWGAEYRNSLRRGGWLTLILIAVIIGLTLLAFGFFFVFFHQIFFTEGTWSFYYSDTLIRLFPERFWRDTFLMVGFLSGLGGLFLGLGFRQKKANT